MSGRPRTIFSPVIAWSAMACLALCCVDRAAAAELSRSQQADILAEAQQSFDRAIELRRSSPAEASAHFRDAAGKFQVLVDSGIRNGELYFNLANSCLEAGLTGRAILNYRRAERLLPGEGRIEANLRFARSLRRNEIPPTGERALLHTLFFWHYNTPLRTRFEIGLACYLLFWTMLIARTWVRRRGWAYLLVPALLMAFAMVASAAIELNQQASHREGVILADEVVARKGDSEGFEPSFQQKLYQGVEFNLIERRGDWLHIQLPDSQSGWIRTEQAELI